MTDKTIGYGIIGYTKEQINYVSKRIEEIKNVYPIVQIILDEYKKNNKFEYIVALDLLVKLSDKLEYIKQENKEFIQHFEKQEEQIKYQENFIDGFLQATNNSEWLNKSILDDEADSIIEKVQEDYNEMERYKQLEPLISRILKQCETFEQVKSLSPIDFLNNLLKKEQQLDQLKAENEEYKKLKEYLKISEITTLEDGDLIFTSKVFDELVQENSKLKQVLDEIEQYTTRQFCDNCEEIGSTELTCHCEFCEYGEILNIINKAKEE